MRVMGEHIGLVGVIKENKAGHFQKNKKKKTNKKNKKTNKQKSKTQKTYFASR